jgi:hypothetical protein
MGTWASQMNATVGTSRAVWREAVLCQEIVGLASIGADLEDVLRAVLEGVGLSRSGAERVLAMARDLPTGEVSDRAVALLEGVLRLSAFRANPSGVDAEEPQARTTW